ncbi:MAG TPA: TlpA disulfide reductase family protein [Bryobacteraceae bacterium]|nr:TlpA disulfide reductase family protein [Bryobacteraceae bacterium]
MTRRGFVYALAAGATATAAGAAQQKLQGQTSRPSPEFVITQVNGQRGLLSQYKGKVIALEFLHTTCPHCQTASGLMQKMYKEYGPKGFQPIGIAFNDMAALLVPDYVKQLGLTFPVGVAPRDDVKAYLVETFQYVPIMVFIDKNFTIRGQYVGDHEFFKNEEANMRATIEMLLKEQAKNARPAGKGGSSKKR